MEQMAGIFIVFAAGIGVGLLCMVFEYLFAASTDTFKDNIERVCIKKHILIPIKRYIFVLSSYNPKNNEPIELTLTRE